MSNTSNLTLRSGVRRRCIASGWTFRKSGDGGGLPASVPGTVHTDLFMNGRIPDPYFRDNERDLQWIGYADWVYSTRFKVETEELEQDAVELVFYGLDTYAEVYVNGTSVCTTDNMFRTWRIDVSSLVTRGDTLSLYIVSDRRDSMKGSLRISVWDFTGEKIREERSPVEVPARASAPVAAWQVQELLLGNRPESSAIEFAFEGYQTLYYPVYCREMFLPRPKIMQEVIETPSGAEIRISTDVLAKYVYIRRDEDSLQLSDNYFDMLPGETRVISARHTPDELGALRIRTLADTYRTKDE